MRSGISPAVAIVVLAIGASASADVTIQYTPTTLQVGQTVNLSIHLVANPGSKLTVAGITFNFDDGGDAWSALNPTAFTWVAAPMQDPGQWLINENLPSPSGLALFSAASITIPAGGTVEFARLTVTPVAGGVYDWSSNISPLFASNGVPLVIKGGEPFSLTVEDASSGACCLANGTCVVTTLALCDAGGATFAGTNTDCSDVNGNGHADVCTCPGDLDDNGVVGTSDLLLLLASWGNAGGPADLDMSGTVGTSDLLLLLSVWGPCF